MKDVLKDWALGRLGPPSPESKKQKREESPALHNWGSPALDEIAKRFGVDTLGREIIALAWAAERSLEVARAAREKAGASARALTVEVVRDALGQSLDVALAANSILRRHALIVLDTAGPALATSELRLGAGMAARLEGAPLSLDGFAPGVRAAKAPIESSWHERFPASAKVAELVKDRMPSVEPLLATADGCPRRDAFALALGAGKRFSRGVIFADGEVLAQLQGRWELLAALRREADLEAMVLVVCQSAALGEVWRALTASPPAQPLRPPLVILADAAHTREVSMLDGLRHQAISVGAVAAAPNATTTATAAVPVDKTSDDPYEVIRRQAQRDAERALGIWKPDPTPPPKTAVAPPLQQPAPIAPSPAPPVAPAPPVVVAAPPEQAEPEKPKKAAKRSRKAMEHFGGGGDSDDEPAQPRREVAPPAPEPTQPVVAATVATTPPGAESVSDNAPYLPLPHEPKVEDLVLVARTSTNSKQRIEMLTALKGLKSPLVVQALRENTKSENATVRAAAEAGMAEIFGAAWNRTRAVAKPVQPPPTSDDKNPNRPW